MVDSLFDDELRLREIVGAGELPALLPALAYLTGDMSLVDDALRPPLRLSPGGLEPQGGMSASAQALGRERALAALLRYHRGGHVAAPPPGPADLLRLMRFVAGDADEAYLPLMNHELGLPLDAGEPGWTASEVAPGRDFRVVVIGAGMSGLAAAHRLVQAGVDVVVVEKNSDVGGSWWENSYPGCRLDTSNFAYSFSFAQRPDWPQEFSPRDAIHSYFSGVADTFGLRKVIRFGTEALAATFDSSSGSWTVDVRTADGATETLHANAVVTAVGQLNRPRLPDIPGRSTFAGASWHTARWDHATDLTGKRVAVIGTGASAYQVVPSIAGSVAELTVFQRTPPWMLPTPAYHDDIPDGQRWLLRNVPHYHRWFRFLQFWLSIDGRRPFVTVDPSWEHPVSVSEANESLRSLLVAHLERQFGDRPDLLAKVMPNYPPGAKRMMRDNGVWPAALHRDDVHLATDPITEIVPEGVRTASGALHAVDVIVYATGFTASDFLAPITITGRGGADLHETWKGDARAYLGIHVPEFPNLFCVFGPNTGLVINGSILLFSEIAVHHILGCIRLLLETGRDTVDVRPEVFDAYQRSVDEGNTKAAWGASTVNSWYKNELGRVSQVWPFSVLDYWRMVREVVVEDYVVGAS